MSGSAPPAVDQVTRRFRLAACALVLAAVAFSQRPGQLVGDTKFDLVVNPAGMLARSLHLWDPQGGFGQVQNQAYGYLFPMGPFFWLGEQLTIPGWVVQRLWWSLLLGVAFVGMVKLAEALGLGTPTTRLVAGFAYALSPRILTTIGPISIEAWPSALAPWVLVPLVVGASRGSPRRAALLSGLAVAAVGGVNAAATFAVIPLGALWLLTREPGPRRRALMTWWPLFVVLGTAWWLVPLLLLGRFSPPFLDYIETASVTTLPTTLFDSLRGTSHWVPFVDSTWLAGNDLISTSYLALNSGVLLLAGVVGMTIRQNPHRQFLVLATLLGLLMVTAGHGGVLQGWFAGTEREALDAALAPLRNVHKFDPVIRIPVVLGLAHLLGVLREQARDGAGQREHDVRRSGDRLAYAGVLVVCLISVAGAAGPALTGRLSPANSFEAVPQYWSNTADWLDQNSDGTTALLVPGSSFAFYVWGDPDDEPLQSLAASRWAVRNAVPLAPAGNIRMLDAIEDQLVSGRPSAGLARYLRRAGIGHLVVRNDLRGNDQPPPVLVHQVLDGSPGIQRVAEFGPDQGSPVRIEEDGESTLVEDGWVERYPAVEIYEVLGAHPAVVASSGPVVVGGPESLLDLLDVGELGDEPTILAVDAPEGIATDDLILTDGLRRREASFARIHDGRSATLEPDDTGRRGAPARDYSLGEARWETQAQILGARSVTASSSRAFADTSGPVLPETLPFAAYDGLTNTAWESDGQDGLPWVELELENPLSVAQVTVVAAGEEGDEVDQVERIQVETDQGLSESYPAPPGQPVTIPLPPGRTSAVRVLRAAPHVGPFRVAEIQIPGVDVDRTLVLPLVEAAWGSPDLVLLSATAGWREACVSVDDDVRCAAGRARVGEEPGALDRTLRLGTGAAYEVSAMAAPVDGQALQGLIQRDQLVNVRSSSSAVQDARASAVAAIDGDPGTTWTADPDDEHPTLSLEWLKERTVRAVHVALDRQAAASEATRLVLDYPGGRQTVELDDTGRAEVEPFRATRVDVRLVAARTTESLHLDGTREPLGVGVSELRLGGTGLLPIELSDVPVDLGCEFGPTLRVGIGLYPTAVTASPQQLFSGGALPARVCGPPTVDVPSGSTRVVLSPAPAFRGVRVLMRTGDRPPAIVSPVDLEDDSPVSRVLVLPPGGGAALAAVRENQNEGWVASAPGPGEVTPVTVDGWQQGWQLTGPVERVEISYGPDRWYRAALAVGLLMLALLAALAVVRRTASGAQPGLRPRRIRPVLLVAGGLLALGLMAGWAALACGAGGVAMAVLLARWGHVDTRSWVAGLLVAAASLYYALRPLGSSDGWAGALGAPQLLVAVALGVLLSVDLEPGRLRSLRRMAGRSSSQ
ncbi:hypothetical protein NSZ01_06250 [Nocardioides szechwanensis]|uniref:Arabinofuranan 3-O-arabinosyltransferase n=1 Tax=Nocardioides szechwanensis TaxID=1005944 RepID=A0A1G9VR25_9ACTN|nr:alpha-(1->3)-arabinofuranosyltransferase [Nocardioides szechwanensis]GEP32857.1 hypothetical protein NSZ01_06250 [Nocardioides szechwanensis]SDM74639.1 arabinofuranan 3-O-arabinosyltransferase [Nocardioides szechwanensis]